MKINLVPSISKNNYRGYLLAKKAFYLLLILVFIQLLNQFLIFSGGVVESMLDPGFQYSRTVVGVYQQIIQAVTGIVLYQQIFKRGISDLGVNKRNSKLSMKFFYIFALVWAVIIASYIVITYFFFPTTWEGMKAIPLPQTNTMVATLLFQSFFPGMGEEILFRGFIITLLSTLVFTHWEQNQVSKIGIIILSSAYFASAHIYFTVIPFQVTHIDYLQIAMAFGCGTFYASFYLKTKSLLAPFLAHNFSNTTSTICGYIISGI